MQLSATVKLLPTPEQVALLLSTLERANAACNWIGEQAWAHRVFSQYALHHLAYAQARTQFGLGAQAVVRCIAKVVQAYRASKEVQCLFRPHGAVAFDSRILAWRVPDRQVSIWTLTGRQTLSFAAGERQLEKGESDLLYRQACPGSPRARFCSRQPATCPTIHPKTL